MRDIPAFADTEARQLLEQLCAERGIEAALIEDLATRLAEYSGRGRADGLAAEFWELLGTHVEQLQKAE